MPVNQEEGLHQEPDCARTQISDCQPPLLGEIHVCTSVVFWSSSLN